MSYNVIVSTCISAGYLTSLGLKEHFNWVCIDESGQAMEPEVLIPIQAASSVQNKATLVLVGDPKQLGPIIRSPIAQSYGLNISLLERLCTQMEDQRAKDPSSLSLPIVKLESTYRAHPAILKLYSDMFYEGKLVSFADESVTHSLLRWRRLPNPDVPLLFIHSDGEEDRDPGSPSWYNQREMEHVMSTIDSLKSEMGVPNGEIGVITPYRLQADKLKRWIHRDPKFSGVQVGVTEEFQGKEKKVLFPCYMALT